MHRRLGFRLAPQRSGFRLAPQRSGFMLAPQRSGLILAVVVASAASMVGCTPPKPTYVFKASPLAAEHALALTGDEIMGRGRPPEQWVEVASGRPVTERFPDVGAMDVDGIGDEVKRYIRDEDGRWFLESVDAIGDRSRSEFGPALGMAPARLAPGEMMTAEAQMRVTYLKDGTPRTQGPARRTLEHGGAMIAELPTGPTVVQLVKVRFDSAMTSAQATHVAELYILPGFGPVAERTSDLVRVFGLRLRESNYEFVRDIEGTAIRR
ncbi:MAG: hypothetical protein FJ254_08200 [Phycisphaerae bacterium]|nr:hypothetical protein [Phycisphaerae bacterium]